MKEIDGISVVICCYNSESRIEQVLTHLMAQEGDEDIQWEVLVIDNASTDATREKAMQVWKHPRISMEVIAEMNPGLSFARRKGLDKASFEIISFIDDDNWVEKHWIRKVNGHMNAHPSTGVLGGKGEAAFEGEEPQWFGEFQRSYAVGPQAPQSGQHHTMLYGAGLNIRKQAWDMLVENEFSFILSDRKGASLSSGGDAELCMAVLLMGYELYYASDLEFKHYMPAVRITWDYLARLNRAFAQASPIMNIYIALYKHKGLDRYKYTNVFLAMANSCYNYFRARRSYMPEKSGSSEGNGDYLALQFHRAYLKNQFRMVLTFPSIVRNLKKASWRGAFHA